MIDPRDLSTRLRAMLPLIGLEEGFGTFDGEELVVVGVLI